MREGSDESNPTPSKVSPDRPWCVSLSALWHALKNNVRTSLWCFKEAEASRTLLVSNRTNLRTVKNGSWEEDDSWPNLKSIRLIRSWNYVSFSCQSPLRCFSWNSQTEIKQPSQSLELWNGSGAAQIISESIRRSLTYNWYLGNIVERSFSCLLSPDISISDWGLWMQTCLITHRWRVWFCRHIKAEHCCGSSRSRCLLQLNQAHLAHNAS